MSVRNSLLCFGALVLMTGAATAKPAYVASTVNLRKTDASCGR